MLRSCMTEMTHDAEGPTEGKCSYCFVLDVQVSFLELYKGVNE